jgi:WD40 repeat protein
VTVHLNGVAIFDREFDEDYPYRVEKEGFVAFKVSGNSILRNVRIRELTADDLKAEPEPLVGEVRRFPHPAQVRCVAFTADGKEVLAGGLFPGVAVWDASRSFLVPRMIWTPFQTFTRETHQLCLTPDKQSVVFWDGMNVFRLHLGGNGCFLLFEGGKNKLAEPIHAALTPDGARLLVSDYRQIVEWDLSTQKELRRLSPASAENPRAAWSVRAYSPDATRALVVLEKERFDRTPVWAVWDLVRNEPVRTFQADRVRAADSAAFTADGRRVILTSADGSVRLVDVATGADVRSFSGHRGAIGCLAISVDGRRLLTGGQDGTIRLWDLDTGRELHCFTGHSSAVTSVAFSPDGRFAVSAGMESTARLWKLPAPQVPAPNPAN